MCKTNLTNVFPLINCQQNIILTLQNWNSKQNKILFIYVNLNKPCFLLSFFTVRYRYHAALCNTFLRTYQLTPANNIIIRTKDSFSWMNSKLNSIIPLGQKVQEVKCNLVEWKRRKQSKAVCQYFSSEYESRYLR